jgi:hypothetical protein
MAFPGKFTGARNVGNRLLYSAAGPGHKVTVDCQLGARPLDTLRNTPEIILILTINIARCNFGAYNDDNRKSNNSRRQDGRYDQQDQI